MKIIIAYPPLNKDKGLATLGQNRQFQYFKEPTFIYPVVPAQAATLLKSKGFEVIWLDCIAQGLSLDDFLRIVRKEKPDLVAMETKTPVIKQIWRIIDQLKKLDTDGMRLATVLFGDHVTALPEESFQNSQVDFVLTGGDYDFLLLSLCNYLNNQAVLEPGIYYRENGELKNTGKFRLSHNLDSLPFIDRGLTQWQLYAYKNGNYKRTPGTYIMSGRDCWWGRCSFCSWPTLYPNFRTRSVENVLDEIGMLIKNNRVREIMDDTGCFNAGEWLRDFTKGMVDRGFAKKIYFDCNMRFGALKEEDFRAMKKANFRLLLFGLESANQATLDRINKNLKVERIIEDCRMARKAGLFPHITIMFGYPWESYPEAWKTMELGKWLLKKGYAYTMQATVVIPYPGSGLFEESKQTGALSTLDWDDYDMKQPVMKSPIPPDRIMELVQQMYKVSFSPEFIARKILSIRDFDDLAYSARAFKKVFGHVFDFKRKDCACCGK
ncbi:MAG: radical SAM protein [Candidatus Omnitrophica bacterium]|nr:radical SAM protein [Candidatus Omnitrophota bacterium]MDD5653715.1 radical SAM protein [Candidatus Omnitrophota bacterium]